MVLVRDGAIEIPLELVRETQDASGFTLRRHHAVADVMLDHVLPVGLVEQFLDGDLDGADVPVPQRPPRFESEDEEEEVVVDVLFVDQEFHAAIPLRVGAVLFVHRSFEAGAGIAVDRNDAVDLHFCDVIDAFEVFGVHYIDPQLH
ncbi:hypothetical protein V6N13_067225 [Hibiscus sabdariffa]